MIQLPTNPNYSKNYAGASEYDPCCVCGKAVKTPKAWLHVHQGGGIVVTEAEAQTLPASADLGLQPIGADCLRQHPELKPYVQR